jgi:hypothetical protein
MAKCGGITEDGTRCRNPVKRKGDRCHQRKHRDPPSRKETPRIHRCKAATKKGLACKRRVSREGERCPEHLGLPTVKEAREQAKESRVAARRLVEAKRESDKQEKQRQRQARQEQRRQKREHELLVTAATYCSQAIELGALDAAEKAIADLVTQATWERLTNNWSGTRCIFLAHLARQILEGKDELHRTQGELAGRVVEWVLRWSVAQTLVQALIHSLPTRIGEAVSNALEFLLTSSIARVFTRELVRNLPSPFDHPLVVAARSLQIVGIARCLALDADILQCACFCDMAKNDGKEIIKELIVQAEDNLLHLALHFPQTT